MGLLDNFLKKPIEDAVRQSEEKLRKEYDEKLEFAASEIKLLNQDDSASLPGNWTMVGAVNNTLKRKSDFTKEYAEWVYANVSAIAEAVSHIELKLMRYSSNKDEITEVNEHPVIELMNRPNPYMTKRDFVYMLSASLLLAGEGPIRLRRTGKNQSQPPTELWPLQPANVVIKVGVTADGYEMPVEYDYTIADPNGGIKKIELQPWEVIMMKTVNPNNLWRGLGVVEAAARTIDILDYSEMWNLNFFQNSAIPAAVLYTDQKLQKDVLERLKNNWNSEFRTYKNNFRTAILEQGLKIEKLQSTMQDMDFLEQQKFLRDKLMAMFKTTKIALGIVEDVNRANAEASEYVFTKHNIKPKMQQFVDVLNEFLLPLYDPTGELFFDFEDPLPEDRTAKVSEWSQLVDKVYTKNEVRQEMGLPELDGGDEIWQPVNLVPMTENPTPQVAPIKPTTPASPTAPTDSTQDPTQPDGSDQAVPEDPTKLVNGVVIRVLKSKPAKSTAKYHSQIKALQNRNIELKRTRREFRLALKKVLNMLEVKKTTPPIKQPRYKTIGTMETTEMFVANYLSMSDKAESEIENFIIGTIYAGEKDEIIARIKAKGRKFMVASNLKAQIKEVGDNYMYNKNDYAKLSVDELIKIVRGIIEDQGQDAYELLNVGTSYSLSATARKFLTTEVTKSVKSFSDTTYDTVRASLAEGLAAGESEADLIKRVTSTYSALEKSQAQRIARTETSRAANFANVDAYKQSGVVEAKQWVTVGDPCEFCLEQEGTIIDLDDNYFDKGDKVDGADGGTLNLDYSDVGEPPLHVNCRCTTVPVLISTEKGVKETRNDKVVRLEKEVEALNLHDKSTKKNLLKEIEAELAKMED